MDWHNETIEDVLKELGSSMELGLTPEEAASRLAKDGPNQIEEGKKESRLLKLLHQFTEFIIVVLIGAAVIAGLLGEWIDSIAIMAIVVLNGIIGFTQEEKAERVLESLKKMSAPKAKVLRGGELHTVDASDLVPGDVIALDSGDKIPADSRVLSVQMLKVDEAPLTGESHPVEKDSQRVQGTVPLGDRVNMVYSGTTVVYGRARAIVAETGMTTEMGKIARMLQEVKREPTPLQKKLAEFGRVLVYLAGGVCGLIFLLGVLRGDDLLEMFLTAVSLAVAAIPEGLPAVVTIVLALGVQRMVKRHALIRKLPSVETLGSATLIASDKTGTLTQNQMTVRKVFLSTGETLSVTGAGYEPTGEFILGSASIAASENTALDMLLKTSVLCNEASLKKPGDESGGSWQVIGDPTEGALLTLALKAGIDRKTIGKEFSHTGELPFDSERKMMTNVFRTVEGHGIAFTKGAPERVLSLCTRALSADGVESPLTEDFMEKILATNEEFAKGALRVLGLAFKKSSGPAATAVHIDIHDPASVEKDLVFLGLVGMIDPPREEVFVAVEKAKGAGIVPLMITGDHKLTATAIAEELGIYGEGDRALTGIELDELDEEEFRRLLPEIKVYARVNPEHKLMVVREWKRRGDIVAMTGDGVNDAPALKEADIGIAMGITGTDVTKEASEMVLTDDNFASIISAVEEGRGIFDNIRKVVHFLLSCNIGEIFTLLIAAITGMPLPLLPVQILWMNLVTDGLPALGLAMEPISGDVMDRRPRPKDEGIVTRSIMWVMVIQGAFMAVCTLVVYAASLYWFDWGLEKSRTMAFMVIVYCQMFHVFNCRSERESIFTIGPLSNRLLNLAVGSIFISQVLLVYIPFLHPIFKVTFLDPSDWLIVLGAAVQPLIWMEVVKAFMKKGPAAGR